MKENCTIFADENVFASDVQFRH